MVATQRGLLHARVARRSHSANTVRRNLRRGVWRKEFGCVYVTDTCPLGERAARLNAALLIAGWPSAITGEAALAWYAVPIHGSYGDRVDVALPADRSLWSGSGLHRRTHDHLDWEACRLVAGVLLVPLPTAIVDAWLTLSRELSKEVITTCVRQRRVTAAELVAEIEQRARLAGRDELLDWVRLAGDGCESPIEIDYVLLVERPFRLPPPTKRQQWFELPSGWVRTDASYREERVVIELDGREDHTDDARQVDLARDAEFAALGILVVRLTGRRIRGSSAWTARVVLKTLVERRRLFGLPPLGPDAGNGQP